MRELDRIGRRSVLFCPDCHGVMWEIEGGDLVRYRWHVGHAYSGELMSLALDENLTRALAAALRALDERTAIAKKLQKQATEAGRTRIAESWERKARGFEEEAKVIRDSVRRTDEIAARFAAE
jgi:two-component system chemotaxis response regulator CheB